MTFFHSRSRPSFGEALRRRRTAAAVEKAVQAKRLDRIEASVANLAKEVETLRPVKYAGRYSIRDRAEIVSAASEEHRRLMALQKSIPVRDRIFFDLKQKRYWKWDKGCDQAGHELWRKRDTATNEFFGGEFRKVEFIADGFRASYTACQGNPGTITTINNPSIDDSWGRRVLTLARTAGRAEDMTSAEYAEIKAKYKPEMTTMNPLKLSILLWRAAHPLAFYPDPSPPVRTALAELAHDGFVLLGERELLDENLPLHRDRTYRPRIAYRLTLKATVFIEHLVKQPLPVQAVPKWEVPTGAV